MNCVLIYRILVKSCDIEVYPNLQLYFLKLLKLYRFDENFEMVLPEDTDLETTFLLFTVKDKCLMGEGIFLGESLLPLKNIQKNNSNVNFKVNFIIMINIRTNNLTIVK